MSVDHVEFRGQRVIVHTQEWHCVRHPLSLVYPRINRYSKACYIIMVLPFTDDGRP
jgi:hypothetical protein